jgi:hypothetical protein
MHFLYRSKATILENINLKEDLNQLDAQLFGLYKKWLPNDAPGSALKRWNSKQFWQGVSDECSAKEEADKMKTVSRNFQGSALNLLDDAREVSVASIRKRLRDIANQEGESSTNTSAENISHHDINRPFLQRVRSKVMNFKIRSSYVAEVHKQE